MSVRCRGLGMRAGERGRLRVAAALHAGRVPRTLTNPACYPHLTLSLSFDLSSISSFWPPN